MFGSIDTPTGRVGFHLNTVAPRRVVPASERHAWTDTPAWGESVTCKKCGCVKTLDRGYNLGYRMPGSSIDTSTRPPCPGKPAVVDGQ